MMISPIFQSAGALIGGLLLVIAFCPALVLTVPRLLGYM